ncbi:MAG: saccharopine dehydrogenase NADP-binding domain-containing protein [Candidatus Bathyarchaeia archaeon]
MKILILGGYGAQGSVICYELAKHKRVSEIVIAGRNLERAKALKKMLKSDKLSILCVDLNNVDEVQKAVKGCDLVVNSASYVYDIRVMKAALAEGANFQGLALGPCVDAPGAPTEKVLELMLEMDKDFKNIGRVALIATGEDPGITDLVAGYAADKFERVLEIRMKDASLQKSESLVSTWAPELLWYDMIQEPYVYEDGVLKRVPPFSGEEIYTFPEPLGPQPCYHHYHEEPPIMARFIKGLRYAEFKMGGPFMPYAKAIYDLGLVKDEKIKVSNVEVKPFDVFCALIPKPPSMSEIKEMISKGKLVEDVSCIVTDIKCIDKGKEIDVSYISMLTLKEANKRIPGATATSYMVGVGGGAFTEVLVEGSIRSTGVVPPEALLKDEKEAVIRKLAEKGIKIQEIVKRELA